MKLSQLTAEHLDDLYGFMEDDGKSPKTIRDHHAIISSPLHQGVRSGWVKTNGAEQAKPAQVAQRRVQTPSVDVVRDVIEEAERRDPKLAPLLMLAALTRMRRGELCALRWSDVDLKLGSLEVSRSVVVVVGGVTEKTAKTDRSRTVALDAVGIALMERHHEQVLGWVKEAGGKSLPPDAFVFSPVVDSLIPFRPDNVTSFFIRVRNEVGAPSVRLYDLRHFITAQLIGAGVDVRTVAGRLGHSDPSLTLRIYRHALEERDRAAATIMGNILSVERKKRTTPQLPSKTG